MNGLEIIELRSTVRHQPEVEREITELAASARRETTAAVRVFRNKQVDTDWSIHLRVESPGEEEKESSLGLRLAEALRKFGLVYHAVWVEISPQTFDTGYKGG